MNTELQVYVTETINKVCPIHGVSFGKLYQKETWRIDFKDEATAAQKKAAAKWLASFNLDGFTAVAETKRQIAALEAQQTPRRLRDAALGQEEMVEGKPFMQWLDEQIAALRSQLKG